MSFPVPPASATLLFGAAALAGALNSVAGGGSFITFPSLLFAGVPAVQANATNTVAIWPGSAASVGAYRRDFNVDAKVLIALCSVSAVGGVLGGVLLLHTPEAAFRRMIPYLLAFATLVFALSRPLTSRFKLLGERSASGGSGALFVVSALQLVIAVYGGYFGGGIGILMLATLSVMGIGEIHSMNAVKTLLSALINAVAAATFVVGHAVDWYYAVIMMAGAIFGGYLGAHFARRLNPAVVRAFVMSVGVGMSIYFFWRR